MRNLLALLMLSSATAAADADHLGGLSIEQLMNESVTSVSKREQKLGDVAAAITVLTNDDLRRSGATSVVEALRLVPGLDVAAVNSSQSAISARGFNNLYANKLLVLVDGRTVYTPLFAGVFWDLQQVMLEDVDRIEVIRGPGATIWGANAVNGVINVVTRDAADSQGGLVYAGGGNVHRAQAGARYGGRVDERTHFRAFTSYWDDADFPQADGVPAGDAWKGWQGGFRVDRQADDRTHLTWQADATRLILDDEGDHASNINTLVRWRRAWSGRSGIEIQAFYDRTHRVEDARSESTVETLDFNFQQTFGVGERHDLIWGFGYSYQDMMQPTANPAIQIRDTRFGQQLFTAFVQDEYRAIQDRLTLTAGLKVEHNDYTGVELQPSVRAAFKPRPRQTLWAAISRATRTPAVAEGRDAISVAYGMPFQGPDGGSYVPTVVGNPEADSEVLRAYEIGYRFEPASWAHIDVATFYNDYDDLVEYAGVERLTPGTPYGVAEIPARNSRSARSWGGEIVATLNPVDSLRVVASYSPLVLRSSSQGALAIDDNNSPRHQASLRLSWNFVHRASLDSQVRYVGAIAGVAPYFTADARLSYRPMEQLELSLVGQNLLDDQHPEQSMAPFAVNSEVPRGVYGRLMWRF